METLTYQFRLITYYDVLIMEKWKYNGFEQALYMDSYHESYKKGEKPIVGPNGCRGYAVFNKNGELFGIMEYYFEDDGVHLGLAINPCFVGRRLSKGFILSGIEFLKDNFEKFGDIKLEVHRKNIQAIKAYESVGFKFYKRDGDELHYRFFSHLT